MKYTKVFRAKNEIEAKSIQGFLESHKIVSKIAPDTTRLKCPLGGMFPVQGTILHTFPHFVYVKKGSETKAKQLLKGFKQTEVGFSFKQLESSWRWYLKIFSIIIFISAIIFTVAFYILK